jgi:G:T/U-mismatch repair DNA glycosylase
MITSSHKYIGSTISKKSHTSLILGTIHPHNTSDFKIDYFYGNKNSLWTILGKSFPNYDFSSKNKIVSILERNNIWISDIIQKCDREDESETQDKKLKNLILNDIQISKGIKESYIKTIFFTSGFSKNSAAKLFCDKFNITPQIDNNRKFVIPPEIFGKEIECIVLYSPSGQANIGISKSKLFLERINEFKKYEKPVNAFKIEFYKNAFSTVFNS